jgi:hypothetical protein
MLIIDWVMDKLGYTKKVTFSWEHLLREWEAEDLKPIRITKKKAIAKKPAVKKPASKKTVRKKA